MVRGFLIGMMNHTKNRFFENLTKLAGFYTGSLVWKTAQFAKSRHAAPKAQGRTKPKATCRRWRGFGFSETMPWLPWMWMQLNFLSLGSNLCVFIIVSTTHLYHEWQQNIVGYRKCNMGRKNIQVQFIKTHSMQMYDNTKIITN